MQGHWIFVFLGILASVQFAFSVVPAVCPNPSSPSNVCFFANVAKLEPSIASSYFAVGGLFDIHERGENAFTCGEGFSHSGVLLSQAFLWSLDYWQSKHADRSVSVGGVVFDSCFREDQMIQNLLGFEQCNLRIEDIDRHNLVGFVGTTNSDAMAAAKLTEDMDLTLISPQADSVLLSNGEMYPYFLRTIPSLQVDIDILADLLQDVQTKYVAAIYERSEMASFQAFKMTMEAKNICITSSSSMSGEEDAAQIGNFVRANRDALEKTRFIALFLSPEFAARFMTTVRDDTANRNRNWVFLMTSAIPRNSALFDGSNTVAAQDAIVVERKTPEAMRTAVSDFLNFWNNYVDGNVGLNNRISNTFLSSYLIAYNGSQEILRNHDALASTIMAAKAFVDGTRRAGRDICNNAPDYLCPNFFDFETRGSNIKQKIRSETNYFTRKVNNQYLNGDLKPGIFKYDVFRYRLGGSFERVAEYNGSHLDFTMSLSNLVQYQPGQCPDSPCLQCGELPTTTTTTTTTASAGNCQPINDGNTSAVYYPHGQEITGAYMQGERMDSEYATRFEVGQRWIIALGVLAGLGILAVLVFEIYILYKLLGTRMGHKWRTMWLGQLLLFGIFLCYLTLFAYLPIPTDATCGITRFGVGVSYSICFAVLLVKLMVILTSKSTESSLLPGDMESPNYLKGVYQFLMFVFVVGVQVVIDAQWLITVPPEAIKVRSNAGKEVWICNHYTFSASGSMSAMTVMSNFVRNEFENHVLSLVYIMFLILITTCLALNAHGIITNHRESVFIGIAAGFSIPIWLAWTLVGGLNKDHDYAHEFGDACIAFGLFLTATLILFAMFLPKVRQLVSMGVEGIYFEDDRDTVYAGSVIMPPSYKSRPNSVIYVDNQRIYSEPVVLGNGDSTNYMRHPGSSIPTPASTYSAPPTYLKKGGDSTIRGGSVLRVTDDLSGRRPIEKKRPMSEVAYGTARSGRSQRGTLPRSRSQTDLGAL
ncbi:metabotropic glutamate receptor 2-like [Babylonia areolata]|uniref:metabotropic glutamate receptor 2-like n=1 Tax=Babylonia areolata TaxID=304850 RepID=UPI003FD32F47